jgi:hypothetical protein
MQNNSERIIEEKLKEIRKWRRRGWILFLTVIPACFIGGIITGTDSVFLFIAVLWTILDGYSGVRAFVSKCPNCGNYSYIKGMFKKIGNTTAGGNSGGVCRVSLFFWGRGIAAG